MMEEKVSYGRVEIIITDSFRDNLKHNIIFQVINTEQNKKMLSEIPNRSFLDLSIIYRWLVGNGDLVYSTILTNEFADKLGLSEEQLFKLAKRNTCKLMPYVITTMADFARMDFEKTMPSGFDVDSLIPVDLQNIKIISNNKSVFAANSILYIDMLHELAQEAQSNLYILPSSVHDLIVVPVNMGSLEELVQMVTSINRTEVVGPEIKLSDHVYLYDMNTKTVTFAI